MTHGYARCPECGRWMEVEKVDNGVCLVWHGICCGWGQTGFSDSEVLVECPQEAP